MFWKFFGNVLKIFRECSGNFRLLGSAGLESPMVKGGFVPGGGGSNPRWWGGRMLGGGGRISGGHYRSNMYCCYIIFVCSIQKICAGN